MKILLVHSGNAVGGDSNKYTFVKEQGDALQKQGCEVYYYAIVGKGINGYLSNIRPLKQKIKELNPDIIHAHYGLSGLLANLQRSVPVVTTYHGSDINNSKTLWLSKISFVLSKFNIFVSRKTFDIAGVKVKYSLIPCGIDTGNFVDETKEQARMNLGWDIDSKIVLFAGAFNNKVKNYPLAKKSVELLDNVELKELNGYSRKQMSDVFYAADALLMTSYTEGSPQVVKEAMFCGCPIVSVDVGDVSDVIDGVEGCYITTYLPQDIASALRKSIAFNSRNSGRTKILELGLTNEQVVDKLINIYESIITK
jgi:glycosyltransferase involved in cell wall biosynthesis